MGVGEAVDVGSWLRALGLAQYEGSFRENDVDAHVLRTLSAEDLKELGVTSLGHRKRLLEAIAHFEAPAPPPPETTPAREAERRQLTVMFCDLVGSTALAARLDPEDMGGLIRAYQECCAEVIKRWDGHVAKYMGDGVLAYFGYPRAHEDDAERAVRAGLELAAAVGRLGEPEAKPNVAAAADCWVALRSTQPTDDGAPLAARVGIATGLVMVGELIGEGAAQEQAVVGETPNLAARLQGLAEAGGVVIAEGTRRLVGGLFELADLGPLRLKGFAATLAAWRVEGEGRAASRFEALHGEHLTPLVGRAHELGILLERWAWARDGDGQVVLLAGEPGIGKSRLIRALRARLGAQPYTPLSHYGSPYHTNSALHPVIGHLERAAGFARDEPPAAQLARLEALLGRASDRLDEILPPIAALLGVPTGGRYPALALTPEVQKRRTLQALVDQLAGLAAVQPVLALFEDAHWIDPSTLELLGLVIERIRALPVLVVITFRPEFQLPWTGHAHVTTVTMGRLGRRQGADLVAGVSGARPLPAAVLDEIVARADGVPLFVEELTKSVLESGLLANAGAGDALAGPPLAIPATLHDSLMARLDRLGPVKEVAQIGAVIGREFAHDLLAAVTPLGDHQLADALEQLVNAELVFRRGTPPDAIYSFKHALVQDAAYQSLLKSRRQQLHATLAAVLEERFPDVADTGPEVLARHLSEAGLTARAIPWWRRAGERAAGRSANVEAIAHLSRGLELIGTLPAAADHLEEELALRLAIGGPLIAAKGEPAPEVEETYRRAWALCEQLGRSGELFPVLRGLWNCYLVRGELARAHDLAERLVRLADDEGMLLRRALARRARGATLFFLGRLTEAAAALDEGSASDDAVAAWEDPAHLRPYAERAGVVCRLYASWALGLLGFPDRAAATMAAALALSQRLADVRSLAFALCWAAYLHNLRREFGAAQERAEAAIEIGGRHHLAGWLAIATVNRGFALASLGQQVTGLAQLDAGIAQWNGVGAHLLDTQWLGLTAEAHLRAGQPDDALRALDRAAATATATGERHYQAELYRLRGMILAAAGDAAGAAAWLQRAIDTARAQDARLLELRAATGLARLWLDQGNRAAAHALLAPVYAWFTEGFDTADLEDAKALLDALR